MAFGVIGLAAANRFAFSREQEFLSSSFLCVLYVERGVEFLEESLCTPCLCDLCVRFRF